MRRSLPLILTLATVPAAGFAQTCEAPTGPIESCVIGAWIGTSTIPEAMERMMQSLPENVRANFNDFGRPVGMIIYEDGFFETFPMGVDGNAVFRDDRGNVTQVEMNAQTITTAGYVSAFGGMFDYCQIPGGEGGISGQMTVTSDGGTATAPLAAPPGPPSFSPVVTYTCSGDTMQQQVALPEPLGTIIYDLVRVDLDVFPEEFRSRVEDLPSFD